MKIIEKRGKTVDEAVEAAAVELGIKREDINPNDIEVVSEGKRGILGLGTEDAVVRVSFEESPLAKGEAYVKQIVEKMGIKAEYEGSFEDETVKVVINGDPDEVGLLIGRRGETLDAIQYLTSLVVNKEEEDYLRVMVDTENYRKKREETLIKLAKRMASLAIKTRRNINLDPMNPNERRIIHSALQDYKNVTTYSSGQEPNRYVVITTKKKEYGSDYVSKYRYNRKENELVMED